MALKAAAMMRSSGSAMRAAGSRMEVEAPSVQSTILVKTMGTVRSLKLAKLSKKVLEEKLEEKRAKCELRRSRIETNKKKMEEEKKKADEKKLQEEKNRLKEMKKSGKVAVKKSSKVGEVEAAPKEGIAPSIQVTGTDGAYQSRPQFQSHLPVPRIYWRAEIAKREEARRIRQLGKIEAAPKEEILPTNEAPAIPVTAEASLNSTVVAYQSLPEVVAEKSELYQLRSRLVKKLDGTKEGGLDLFRKNKEARRAERECKLEKKRKKEEEARKKQEEKQMEEERKLVKEINDCFKSVSKGIREAKKSVVKKPSRSVVKKMAVQSDRESDSMKKAIGTREAWRAELKCLGLEKSKAELKAEISDLLRRRAEICELLRAEIEKKREMEEERIKRALESASPTGVLQERSGFGWSEYSSRASSSCGSSVRFASGDDDGRTRD